MRLAMERRPKGNSILADSNITTAELAEVIRGDASALSLYRSGNDSGCALRCSQIATARRIVTTDEVQKIASFGGAWGKVALASQSTSAPDDIRALAITFREWILRGYGLDFTLPQVATMTATLVSAGLATQAEVDSLIELSNTTHAITHQQIGEVRQQFGDLA